MITAPNIPLTLGDAEYLLSPLTDKDITELDEWVQSRIVAMSRMMLVNVTSPVEREEIIRSALKAAATMTWMSGEGARMMSTIDGLTRLVWQSLKKNHKDVTLEQLRALMVDPINAAMFNATFRKANHVVVGDVKKGAQGEPHETTSTGD